ncbi:hypothetical protein CERZMDRAFT_106376 [Cercospora zeae-maydis SCOH1-5]|uniref:Uncharacterized protein n=1 Tax=Cercospora zeae-maydis SCOH1-5 TaxID=717836 RepID=A0A6A6FEH3_9PEZI|nr:hypothetical protein CERZMDRAFT_106376 [Cercospora zeae-maydis SCOH1-5]
MPGQDRCAFSTPDVGLPLQQQAGYHTGVMRLNSTEARFDAFASQAFRATQLPRVQESSRRLEAIVNNRAAEPWYDVKEVKVWRMPQRVAFDREQATVQVTPVSRVVQRLRAEPLPTIPEIVFGMAVPMPSPRAPSDAMEVARPSRKRKPESQSEFDAEQRPAQRVQLDRTLHGQARFQTLQGPNPQLQQPWAMHTAGGNHWNAYPSNANNSNAQPSNVGPRVRQLERPLRQGPFTLLPVQFPSAQASNAGRPDAWTMQPPSIGMRPHTPIPAFDPRRTTIFRPLLPTYHKASPPPYLPLLADLPSHPNFLYWTPPLTRQIFEWLNEPSTDSTQIGILSVTFRDANHSFREQCKPSQPGHKLKITRMTISGQAGINRSVRRDEGLVTDGADLLDWFVIEFSETENSRVRPPNYWIMAFPVCAVTKTQREYIVLGEPGSGASNLYKTTWTLGRTNCMPLLHGNGVREAYLQTFFSACMFGLGVIEMESFGGLFN